MPATKAGEKREEQQNHFAFSVIYKTIPKPNELKPLNIQLLSVNGRKALPPMTQRLLLIVQTYWIMLNMHQNIVFNIALERFENSLLLDPYVACYQNFSWHDRCRSTLQKVISMSSTKGKWLQFEIQRKNITMRSPRKEENKLHHITFYDTKWDVGNVISLTWFIL